MGEERKPLSAEEAAAMLPDGEWIHTFMNPAGMMLGADWARGDVIEMFQRCGVELSGKMATAMKHGLVSVDEGKAVFVQTREVKDAANHH